MKPRGKTLLRSVFDDALLHNCNHDNCKECVELRERFASSLCNLLNGINSEALLLVTQLEQERDEWKYTYKDLQSRL